MNGQVTISFPGLGIEEFTVNKTAFILKLFGREFPVAWYGLIITTGIILAFIYATYRAKQEKIIFDDLLDITIFSVIFGVLGARFYYVLMTLGEGHYKTFIDVIAIWEGGLAIYGAIIAGIITIITVCKIKKIPMLKVFDFAAPAVMIGQILGRWGNFFNGEAYGYKVPEGSPLYFIRMGLIPNINSSSKMHFYHPTFLYESVWNLLGFIIINLLYKKKKFDGQMLYTYIAWYGFGRMFIEGLRTDSLYLGPFRISQVVGFVCFLVGVFMIVFNFYKLRVKKLSETEYSAAYPRFKTTMTEKNSDSLTSTRVENDTDEASDEDDGEDDDGEAEEN